MKKILGNFIFLIVTASTLFATVTLKVDKLGFYRGDSVNITIKATGDDVKFPNIKDIAGYNIVGVANSSQTTIINSKVSHTKSRTYTIVPQNSFTIEPMKVIVDGKEEWTPKKEVKLLKPSSSAKKGGDIVFELKADKTHLRVGESTTLKLILKKKAQVRADKILIGEFKNSNFWIKKLGDYNHYIDGEYEVYVYEYQITPQKAGTFIIDPIEVNIGKLTQDRIGGFNDPFFDQFFQTMKYKKYFSNSLSFKVDPLPQNVEVFGDFEIFATVDKKEVEANKPVNLTIKILGEGNVEDIKKFSLNIPQAVIYSDEPKTKSYVENGKTYGEFLQKIAIIADSSYTIPSIEFKYFDKTKNRVVTKKTAPIKIKVKGEKKLKETPKIITAVKTTPKTKEKQQIVIKKEDSYIKYIYLVVGFILGILATLGGLKLKNFSKKEETPIEKKIRKAKSDRELFDILLPFASNQDIKNILEKLEANIYNHDKNRIDKEEIIEILEEGKKEL
jgi:hypothetical protein